MGDAPPAERRPTISDASVLLNFIGLDRLNLLTQLPGRRIMITAEVDAEIKRDRRALEEALRMGEIELVQRLLGDDAELFGRLTKRLSVADASCIIAARALKADLAVDDRRCRTSAVEVIPGVVLLDTEGLLAEAIRAGLLTPKMADALLAELAGLRYRPKIASFADLGFDLET